MERETMRKHKEKRKETVGRTERKSEREKEMHKGSLIWSCDNRAKNSKERQQFLQGDIKTLFSQGNKRLVDRK